MLCTLVMTDNVDASGVARYPVGSMPVLDPQTGKSLVDELGRISYTTSVAYGPTLGKNIALAYLPHDYCQVGRKLNVEYFAETYPVEVAAVTLRRSKRAESVRVTTLRRNTGCALYRWATAASQTTSAAAPSLGLQNMYWVSG